MSSSHLGAGRHGRSGARRISGSAVAGCCAAFAFCFSAPGGTPKATGPPSPSVILISVDTLRADHLGVYGYRRAHTPNIDSLAEHGTVFRDVSAQVPLTLPSHFSLFTSTYPFANRVEENAEQVSSSAVTLASILRAQGYSTAAFIGAIYLERELGIDRGFDFYDSPFHFEAFSPISGSMFYGDRNGNPLRGRDRRDGALVTRAATQWLNANRDKPAFAFVHLFDLHQPYHLPPAEAGREAPSAYDAALAYVDRVVGSFRQALIRSGRWDRSLVILLSDHGESLGEHGEDTHGYFIYQSTLHVPLIIHWPSGAPDCPPSVDYPAGLIDVAPTILDFLHLPAPPSFAGRTLLRAPDPGTAVYAESVYSRDAFGWSDLRSLRLGKYKYIAAPHPELYNLEEDPHERHNLIARQPAEARSLQRQLANLLAGRPSERRFSASSVSPEKAAVLAISRLPGSRTGRVARGCRPGPQGPVGRIQTLRTRARRDSLRPNRRRHCNPAPASGP